MPEPLHVVPTWGPEHVTDGSPCWCEPEVTDADVVVHREPAD